MSGSKAAKKLPKRTSNQQLKQSRAASWARGKERKQQRRDENKARRDANIKYGTKKWDKYNARRREAWTAAGSVTVARTSVGNIIRPDGSVEACCNSHKRDYKGGRAPCVHFLVATGNRESSYE